MSIGLVVAAGLAIGGAFKYRKAVKEKEEMEQRMRKEIIRNKSLKDNQRQKNAQIQELASELNRVKSLKQTVVKPNNTPKKQVVVKQYNSSNKENFYDTYRALDVNLARVIGKGEKGVNVFIRASEPPSTQFSKRSSV